MRPRMTTPTKMVLRALLDRPTEEHYGLELAVAVGIAPGTVYPILARLEQIGWVMSRWEAPDAESEGRPRRRYYRVDPDGAEDARLALASSSQPAPTNGRLRNPGLA
jgi:PadR family transcriptional regulator